MDGFVITKNNRTNFALKQDNTEFNFIYVYKFACIFVVTSFILLYGMLFKFPSVNQTNVKHHDTLMNA